VKEEVEGGRGREKKEREKWEKKEGGKGRLSR